ncbi:MAG: papain-like cysteine protease family protein [Myxococcota bacterium]
MQLIYHIKLVKQERQMSCWFAAAEMIKLCKARKTTSEAHQNWGVLRAHVQQKYLTDPKSKGLLSKSGLIGSNGGQGLTRQEVINWGTFKGFKSFDWKPATFESLTKLLSDHGPLYCAGLYSPQMAPHAIAVAGVLNWGLQIHDYGPSKDNNYVVFQCPVTGFRGLPFDDFVDCFFLPPGGQGVLMYMP